MYHRITLWMPCVDPISPNTSRSAHQALQAYFPPPYSRSGRAVVANACIQIATRPALCLMRSRHALLREHPVKAAPTTQLYTHVLVARPHQVLEIREFRLCTNAFPISSHARRGALARRGCEPSVELERGVKPARRNVAVIPLVQRIILVPTP